MLLVQASPFINSRNRTADNKLIHSETLQILYLKALLLIKFINFLPGSNVLQRVYIPSHPMY